MLIEALVVGSVAVAVATVVQTVARLRTDRGRGYGALASDNPPDVDEKEEEVEEEAKLNEEEDELEGPRGLRVNDVILHAGTELWLAGMIELREGLFVMRLFPCPGARNATYLVQLDEQARNLVALNACTEVPEGRVPESLPLTGRRLNLRRRGDADVKVAGDHLPRVGRRAHYEVLSDEAGKVLVVLDFEGAGRLALIGDELSNHAIDLLPGGDL